MSSSASCRSLSLPVTPLVKRIILASTKGEALFVSREQRKPFNPYSAYLFALLQRERRSADGQSVADGALTERLEIQIPEWQMRAGCIEGITPARAVAFNTFVTSIFRQRLREEIELRLETTRFLKEAAELALARWGVDEDTYPLSAAIRHYTRHRSETAESAGAATVA
ncbi:hypothetical protein [Fibrella forsythiae]|uniref:Uncharacterized protein n=1 Tax=Fibrella forsythiae TaxID=2817061 RepID=A0ABS3JSG3_9BACT|nr:hypothetical protein [Fibrella forsythiae]MBO0952965.1 hypothetical protein [Fibrella forsythiae]